MSVQSSFLWPRFNIATSPRCVKYSISLSWQKKTKKMFVSTMSKAFYLIWGHFRFRCRFRWPKHFQFHKPILEIISVFRAWHKARHPFIFNNLYAFRNSQGKNTHYFPDYWGWRRNCMLIQRQEVKRNLYLEHLKEAQTRGDLTSVKLNSMAQHFASEMSRNNFSLNNGS